MVKDTNVHERREPRLFREHTRNACVPQESSPHRRTHRCRHLPRMCHVWRSTKVHDAFVAEKKIIYDPRVESTMSHEYIRMYRLADVDGYSRLSRAHSRPKSYLYLYSRIKVFLSLVTWQCSDVALASRAVGAMLSMLPEGKNHQLRLEINRRQMRRVAWRRVAQQHDGWLTLALISLLRTITVSTNTKRYVTRASNASIAAEYAPALFRQLCLADTIFFSLHLSCPTLAPSDTQCLRSVQFA